VLRAVDSGLGEVESDDLAVATEGFFDQCGEDSDLLPLVPPGP
jgi:hypothetical protein